MTRRLAGSTPAEKLALNSERDGECLRWTGAHSSTGHGQMAVDGVAQYVHRVAYALVHGEIPEGLVIDHLCRVRDCIRVDHLEAVTPRENTLRGEGPTAIAARRTTCAKGHPYAPENTRARPDRNGRVCRTCDREGIARRLSRTGKVAD